MGEGGWGRKAAMKKFGYMTNFPALRSLGPGLTVCKKSVVASLVREAATNDS